MTMIVEHEREERRRSQREGVEALKASGALDDLFAKIDAGQVQLEGKNGLIQQLIKAGLERGLQAELTGHVGYEKGDPEAVLTPTENGARNASLDSSDRRNGLIYMVSSKAARRSAGYVSAPSRTVVVRHRLGQMPRRPSWRITFATVLREMTSPSSRRLARIFGDPETSSESPWNQATFCSIRSVRTARFEGFRPSQA